IVRVQLRQHVQRPLGQGVTTPALVALDRRAGGNEHDLLRRVMRCKPVQYHLVGPDVDVHGLAQLSQRQGRHGLELAEYAGTENDQWHSCVVQQFIERWTEAVEGAEIRLYFVKLR